MALTNGPNTDVLGRYLATSLEVSGCKSHALTLRIRKGKRGVEYHVGDGCWRETFEEAVDAFMKKRGGRGYDLLEEK
jgi:hypothetical protein